MFTTSANPVPRTFAGSKTAMSVLGIGNGCMAEPYEPLSADDRETLGRALSEVGTLLSECPAECWTTGVQS